MKTLKLDEIVVNIKGFDNTYNPSQYRTNDIGKYDHNYKDVPLIVWKATKGGEYYLVDGFYVYLAKKQFSKKKTTPVIVLPIELTYSQVVKISKTLRSKVASSDDAKAIGLYMLKLETGEEPSNIKDVILTYNSEWVDVIYKEFGFHWDCEESKSPLWAIYHGSAPVTSSYGFYDVDVPYKLQPKELKTNNIKKIYDYIMECKKLEQEHVDTTK